MCWQHLDGWMKQRQRFLRRWSAIAPYRRSAFYSGSWRWCRCNVTLRSPHQGYGQQSLPGTRLCRLNRKRRGNSEVPGNGILSNLRPRRPRDKGIYRKPDFAGTTLQVAIDSLWEYLGRQFCRNAGTQAMFRSRFGIFSLISGLMCFFLALGQETVRLTFDVAAIRLSQPGTRNGSIKPLPRWQRVCGPEHAGKEHDQSDV
jgi:hypothetical protein